jgi:hypothetical protein
MRLRAAVITSMTATMLLLVMTVSLRADVDPASSPSGPYFTSEAYDPQIPKPSEYLGYDLGSQPASHAQTFGYLRLLAESSPKAELFKYAETYEGHGLYYLVVTSAENMAGIDRIREDHARLADPRKIPESEAQRLLADLPAVVWAGYGIHGDELSSTDAAIAVSYQLVAGDDQDSKDLLDNLIVLIDPMQNPDGRERFLTQVRQFKGHVPNPDLQSMQHTGVWPWGRGNHYFIDLNRDTFTLTHPETRGKMAVCMEWHPQVMIDAHEMGALDSYLFSPPRAPFNPHWPPGIRKWWDIFAADQARALDKYGWSYYTRDWNEEWFPGYTSSWGDFLGIVGILYEQAGVDGTMVKQRTGGILTYSESVHHHLVSSLANIRTAAKNRKDLLGNYYDARKEAAANRTNSLGRAFLVDPSQNPARVEKLIRALMLQGAEVQRLESEYKASNLIDQHGKVSQRTFPAGTYVIDFAQPTRFLLQVLLDYDIRMPNNFLQEERRSLEKDWGTRLYDVSAWSLPLAFGLETYISREEIKTPLSFVAEVPEYHGKVISAQPRFGFMVDYRDDAATYFLADALMRNLKVRVAVEPVAVEGQTFSRGSLLFVVKENPENISAVLDSLAWKRHVDVIGINTAMVIEGPDLGAGKLRLLTAPKIAVLTGQPVDFSDYGFIWHMLDFEYGVRVTSLDITRVGRADLSKYNVVIIPPIWGGISGLKSALGRRGRSSLKDWVEAGGTLVAMDGSAAFCADSTTGFSNVRLRRQALDKLDEYDFAVERELSADHVIIDSLTIWESAEKKRGKEEKEAEAKKPSKEEMERLDEYARKFSPQGVIFECRVDTTRWLTFGLGERLPVMAYGSYVYLSKPPVETALRFTNEEDIRLSGLAWPEARNRWANSAYCTRERKGRGQVILFATHPDLRSFFYGSKRILVNAILLGPGIGARWSIPY